ncbi:hypothetical protein Q7P37_005318 [Cladosporium fusiforme]
MDTASFPPPQSVDEVAQLVKRLYQPGNPQVITSIQAQLQTLQRSNDGWQLADALLGYEDVNIRFFGALTFTVKLNNDGASLDEENAHAVLQRLIHWLVRLVNQGESPMVIRKLCSTLVTFFTRAPIRWQRPLYHLLCSFRHGDALSSEEVTTIDVHSSQLIPALSSAQLISLYTFSSTLADEIGKIEFSYPSQAGLHVQMEREVVDASMLMRHGLQPSGDQKLRGEALRCFLTWATYAQPIWPTKRDALQHLQDLLEPAIQCLLLDDADVDALDVFIDLLESYTSFFQQHHLDALASIIRSHFGPQLEESLREQGGVYNPAGQLIVSYAIAVIEDIVEKPDEDDELSTITIEFWNTYIEYVNDELFSQEAHDTAPDWLPSAKSVTSEITTLLWKKMFTPPGEVTQQWGDAEKEAFRSFRTDATDLLVSVYLFLTSDMLQQLVQLALEALQQGHWRALEAAMLCLNAISDNVIEDHMSDDSLAPLFTSGLFSTLGDFAQKIPTQTRRTGIDMLGNYGPYIERHPESLPDAVRFLFASLETAAFANIAAKSIALLCSTCRHNLTGELDGFLAQYHRFLGGPTSDPYTKEKVIGGVAAIIQALTPESAKVGPLLALLENVERDVSFAKETIASNGDVELAQLTAVTALQCLASIGKALQVPDEVPIDLYDDDDAGNNEKTNFWISEQGKAVQDRITGCFSILEILGNDGEAIDAACQVLKAGYTETAPGPFVLPPSITVRFLQQCSATTPQLESVLSTACTLIHQHSQQGSDRIEAEVQAIYQQVASFAQALGQPGADPGVGHNIIDVFSRLFPRYAEVLLDSASNEIDLVIHFTLQAIEGPDPLPKRSAADFWAKLIRASGPANTTVKVTPEVGAKALQVTNAHGANFTQALIRQIGGMGARSELDYLSEPLRALYSALPGQAKIWVEASLWSEHFPPVVQGVGDAEKRRFLSQCGVLRGGSKTKEIVKEFYIACRGLVSSYV